MCAMHRATQEGTHTRPRIRLLRECECLQPKRNQCLMIHTAIGLVCVAGAGTEAATLARAEGRSESVWPKPTGDITLL